MKLREFLKTSSITKVLAQIAFPEQSLSAEQVTELFRAVQESVNNALKYAAATEIVVSVIADKECLTIDVVDNGSGFDVALAKNKGFGLENMKHRIEAIGGKYAIQSSVGSGTKVSFALTFS